jgi:hypothetical protein
MRNMVRVSSVLDTCLVVRMNVNIPRLPPSEHVLEKTICFILVGGQTVLQNKTVYLHVVVAFVEASFNCPRQNKWPRRPRDLLEILFYGMR